MISITLSIMCCSFDCYDTIPNVDLRLVFHFLLLTARWNALKAVSRSTDKRSSSVEWPLQISMPRFFVDCSEILIVCKTFLCDDAGFKKYSAMRPFSHFREKQVFLIDCFSQEYSFVFISFLYEMK